MRSECPWLDFGCTAVCIRPKLTILPSHSSRFSVCAFEVGWYEWRWRHAATVAPSYLTTNADDLMYLHDVKEWWTWQGETVALC